MRWRPVPTIPGTVDLYYQDLDAPTLDHEGLARFLSDGELARAHRFRFEHHRQRFVAGRGLLRELLGCLTDRHPAEIALVGEANGKPVLPGGPAFNVSHSQNHLVIAIASEGRLGVDLEPLRIVPDALELARGNFSMEEVASLGERAEPELSTAFLRIWTRKEALLKAVGAGLALPLELFSMKVEVASGNTLMSSSSELITVGHWCVSTVIAREEVEVAVAWDRLAFEWRLMPNAERSH